MAFPKQITWVLRLFHLNSVLTKQTSEKKAFKSGFDSLWESFLPSTFARIISVCLKNFKNFCNWGGCSPPRCAPFKGRLSLLLGPLHMSPVTGLARLPGRILRCGYHMDTIIMHRRQGCPKHDKAIPGQVRISVSVFNLFSEVFFCLHFLTSSWLISNSIEHIDW